MQQKLGRELRAGVTACNEEIMAFIRPLEQVRSAGQAQCSHGAMNLVEGTCIQSRRKGVACSRSSLVNRSVVLLLRTFTGKLGAKMCPHTSECTPQATAAEVARVEKALADRTALVERLEALKLEAANVE